MSHKVIFASFGACLMIVSQIVSGSGSPARADVQREQLIKVLSTNCYSTHTANPADQAKCDCFARTFVASLTPAEIAVPKKTALITSKVATAHRICRID